MSGLRWVAVVLVMLSVACSPGTDSPEPRAEPDVGAEDLEPRDAAQALDWLIQGNARFVAGKPRHQHEELARRAKLVSGQNPFGIILGCADSRVAPELIFDHGLGDLFVVRVAGNVVSQDEAGSIEYGIEHLGTRLVLVLGHEGCGAVTAALGDVDDAAPELRYLIHKLTPALVDIDRSLPLAQQVELGVEANVRYWTRELNEIARREARSEDERALIVGAVYELGTGRVRILDRMEIETGR
jgi:carbonic anhydrase